MTRRWGIGVRAWLICALIVLAGGMAERAHAAPVGYAIYTGTGYGASIDDMAVAVPDVLAPRGGSVAAKIWSISLSGLGATFTGALPKDGRPFAAVTIEGHLTPLSRTIAAPTLDARVTLGAFAVTALSTTITATGVSLAWRGQCVGGTVHATTAVTVTGLVVRGVPIRVPAGKSLRLTLPRQLGTLVTREQTLVGTVTTTTALALHLSTGDTLRIGRVETGILCPTP